MNWFELELGNVLTIKHGWSFKGEYFTDHGKYVLLTPGNAWESGGLKLKGDSEKYYSGDFPEEFLLKQGDMLVVMTDLKQTAPILGGAFIIPEDDRFLHNQRLGLITITHPDIVDKEFLYYVFNSPIFRAQIRGSATGATVRHTAPERIYKCKVPCPSDINTQRRIASILSAYDGLIENNNRRIDLLEESMRLLYREWFVRLRFPGHEHVRLVDGLPEGWEKRPLEKMCDLTMGQSPPSETYNTTGEGLPFHQGVTRFGDRFISHEMFCTKPNRVAEPGDILFSVRAPVGRINITLEKIIIGRGLSAIRSKTGNQSFLYYQLKEHFFKEDLLGSGAIFASVTKKELSDELLLLPKSEKIATFEEISKPIDQQITNLHMQNVRLSEARDLLLPRLMSGEIDVS